MQIRDAVFNTIHSLMSEDENIYVIVADMGAWGLNGIKRDYPDKVFNVGVAEQTLINVATGLALMGKTVFAYGIAAFVSYRCLDQIRVNLSGMCLPVTIIGTGADMTYKGDGLTHYAIYDEAMIKMLPYFTVVTPQSLQKAENTVLEAYKAKTPYYIRMGR